LNVIAGGPARESGLEPSDRIVEVGSVRCADVGAERAADLLRGPEHTKVRLLIQREGRGEFEVWVDRRRVEVASIENAHLIDPANGTAYLKINSFQKTTVSELDAALFTLERERMRSLIIDLRGNPGGWLDAAVAVADRFVGEGIIVSTRGKNGIENQNYTAVRGGTWQMPLVVLIDGDSASASEIFAGAIRDHQRGVLVGNTSYGKGSVQGLFHTKSFPGGVRLTVSKFYSPNGTAISERGVAPHIPVDAEKLPADTLLAQSSAASAPASVVDQRAVLSQPYTQSKPIIGGDGAELAGGSDDPALQIAIKQAATPHYTAQMNRN
jgi:carboxyl-terminal processing protease